MNINCYNRKTFLGFVYNLWLYILEFFGVDTEMERWKQKARRFVHDHVIPTVATQKSYHKGCLGNPRFKGYKE